MLEYIFHIKENQINIYVEMQIFLRLLVIFSKEVHASHFNMVSESGQSTNPIWEEKISKKNNVYKK